MRKIYSFILVFMILFVGPNYIFAEEYDEIRAYEDAILLTYENIKTQRKTIIEMNMELTKAEQKKFWPLYDHYHKELLKLNDRKSQLIDTFTSECSNGGDCTESQANSLIKEHLNIEQTQLRLLEKYIAKFKAVLPVKKVIRYFQVENKLDAILNAVLSTQIPLIDN